MIRLLIADDHKVLLDGICSYFSDIDHIEVVDTASNGLEVLDKLSHRQVDIVMLDINMPELNGVETCKAISKKYKDVKVMALSMYKQASYVKRMKGYGAKAYLLKDDSALEMITAIETVHAGGTYYSNKLMGLLISNVFESDSKSESHLTRREKEVLEMIAKGLSNKIIADKLMLSIHTIDSHRKNLLIKFDAKNTADLVRITIEKGLI